MANEDRAALDRAFGYPYAVPPYSWLYDAGFAVPLADADFGNRTPVLAYGSNAAPDQLIRKFGTGPDTRIPVTRAAVSGVDVVYAALFAHYGSVPATIHASEGTEAYVHVTWLTEVQLERMHESEGAGTVYRYGWLPGERVVFRDAPPAERVFVYVAAAGAVGPDPVALEAIPAKGRRYGALSQPAVLREVRDRLAPGTDLAEFVLDTIGDPDRRATRSAALAAGAIPMSVPGFTSLS